jgi:Ca2+-binding RTX toxin-like protein
MVWRGSIVVIAALACALASVAVAATRDGGAADDRLVGTKGADVLRGHGGADVLSGGGGSDRLVGGPGRDVLRGGPGYDELNMAAGAELPSPGDDRIVARDGGPDEISCGAGDDVALVDAEEEGVFSCEKVIEP